MNSLGSNFFKKTLNVCLAVIAVLLVVGTVFFALSNVDDNKGAVAETSYTVNLDNSTATTQGTTSVTATYGAAMPAVTLPIRSGAIFEGYYSATATSTTTSSFVSTGQYASTCRMDKILISNSSYAEGERYYLVVKTTAIAPRVDFNDDEITVGTDYYYVKIGDFYYYYIDVTAGSGTFDVSPYTGLCFFDFESDQSSPSILSEVCAVYRMDGSAKYYAYDGSSVQNWNLAADTTLYPYWKSYKVGLESIDADNVGTTSVTIENGYVMPEITAPVKDNFEFNGYYKGLGYSVDSITEGKRISIIGSSFAAGERYYLVVTTTAAATELDMNDIEFTKDDYFCVYANGKYYYYIDFTTTAATFSVRNTVPFNTLCFVDVESGGVDIGVNVLSVVRLDVSANKYYNADGTAAKTWDVGSSGIIYAYYKSVNELTLSQFAATTNGTTSATAYYGAKPDPNEITLPVRENYIFEGYYLGENYTTSSFVSVGQYAATCRIDRILISNSSFVEGERYYFVVKTTAIAPRVDFNDDEITDGANCYYVQSGDYYYYYIDVTAGSGTFDVSPYTGLCFFDFESDQSSPSILSEVCEVFRLDTLNGSTLYYNAAGEATQNWYFNSDKVLYPRWTQFTVGLESIAADTTGTTSVTVENEYVLPDITAPAKDNFEFNGYFKGLGYSSDSFTGTFTSTGATDIIGRISIIGSSYSAGERYYIVATGTAAGVSIDFNDTVLTANDYFCVKKGDLYYYYIDYTTVANDFGSHGSFNYSGLCFFDFEGAGGIGLNAICVAGLDISANKYYNADGTAAKTWDIGSSGILYAYYKSVSEVTLSQTNATTVGTASTTAYYNTDMVAITAPLSMGYTFNGYYTEAEGAGTKYYNADGTSATKWLETGDIVLYPYWVANEYTVTLDGQNPTTAGTASVTATFGAAMPSIETLPVKTGYSLVGFCTAVNGNGSMYYDGDGESLINWNVADDITLYAYWTAGYYTVTLNDQSATSAGTTSVTAIYDSALPRIENLPRKTGHTFEGYYTYANGFGIQYYDNEGVGTVNWDVAKNTTLYAYWTKGVYTVTLDGQGATTEGTASVSATYEAAMPTIDTLPLKSGLTLDGFYSEELGEGVKYYDADGTSTKTCDFTADATLYARWILDDFGAVTTPEGDSWEYDGVERNFTVSAEHGYGTKAYAWYLNGELFRTTDGDTLSIADVKYSGEIYCTVTIDTDGQNKSVTSDTFTVTITPIDYDMTGVNFVDTTLAYNGTEQYPQFEFTTADGLMVKGADNSSPTVASYDTGATHYADTAEGAITVTVSFASVSQNYNAPADMTATITISKLAVEVDAAQFGKVYGETDPTMTENYATGIGTETVTLTYTRQTGDDVGNYNYTNISYESGDYTFAFSTDGATDKFSISEYTMRISGITQFTKAYGSADPTLTQDFDGVNSDTLTVTYTRASGEAVGSYRILTVSTTNANYVVIFVSSSETEGRFVITPCAISVTPNSFTKVYGSADPTFTQTVSGVNSETFNVTFTRESGSDVGDYDLVSVATSNGSYSVSIAEGAGADKFSITPYAVSVTPKAFAKTYGAADPELTESGISGINGDTFAVTYTREAGENVGYYDIVTVATDNGNYTVSVAVADNNKFKVNPRSIDIVPTLITKAYGAADPDLQGTFETGYFDDEITVTFTRGAGENKGYYNLLTAVCESVNYTVNFNTSDGVNKFQITIRNLEVFTSDFNKTYGTNDPSLREQYNTEYGDTITLVYIRETGEDAGNYDFTSVTTSNTNYSVSFAADEEKDKFVINAYALSVSPSYFTREYGAEDATLSEEISTGVKNDIITVYYTHEDAADVGDYNLITITSDNTNYALSFATNSNRNKFVIVTKKLRITPAVYEKYYGTADPSLSVTINTGVGSETVAVTFNHETAVNAGTYDIIGLTVNEASDNYEIFLANGADKFVINPYEVSVTPDAFGKVYGSEDTQISQTVDGVNSETLDVTFTREAGENAASYDLISVSTANANYSVTIADGTGADKYTVSPYELSVTPISFSKIYGEPDTLLTQTVDGVNSETVEVTFGRASGEDADGYALTSVSATDGNYAVSIADGTGEGKFTIDPFLFSVTPSAFGKDYGAIDPLLEETVATGIGSETANVTYTREAGDVVGTYDLLTVTTSNDNYIVVMTEGADTDKFTINKIDYDFTSVALVGASVAYNGDAQCLAVTGTLPTGLDDITVVPVYSATGTNVGNYDITVTFTSESANYNAPLASFTATLTITKATVTVTATGETFIAAYGETDDVTPVLDTDYTISGLFGTDTLALVYTTAFGSTDPGDTTMTMTVTATGNNNYALSATPTVIMMSAIIVSDIVIEFSGDSFDYNGARQAPSVTATLGTLAITDYTVKYYDEDNNKFQSAPIDAGSYTMRVEASHRYATDASADYSFVINRIKPKFVPLEDNVTTQIYGDFTAIDAIFQGYYDDVFYYATISYSFSSVYPEVGSYVAYATFSGAGNYLPAEGQINFTVIKRTAIVDVSSTAVTYNGKAHSPEFSVSNVLTTDGNVVSVTAGGSATQTAAGTYDIAASVSNDNYVASLVGAENLVINKARLTVQADNDEETLTEGYINFNIVYDGFINGEDESVLTVAPTVASGRYTVGNYTITPDGGKSDNYYFNYVSFDFSVYRNGISVSGDNVGVSVDGYYDGAAAVSVVKSSNSDNINAFFRATNAIQSVYDVDIEGVEGKSFTARIDDENIESGIFTVVYYVDEEGNRTRLSASSVKDGTVYFETDGSGQVIVATNFTAAYIAGIALVIAVIALAVALSNRSQIRRNLHKSYKWIEE